MLAAPCRQYDHEAKFQTAYAPPFPLGSRGLGVGRARSARGLSAPFDQPADPAQPGRMLVPEADRLRLDGLRFAGRLASTGSLPAWSAATAVRFRARSSPTMSRLRCGGGQRFADHHAREPKRSARRARRSGRRSPPEQRPAPAPRFRGHRALRIPGRARGQALHGSLGLIGTLLSGPAMAGWCAIPASAVAPATCCRRATGLMSRVYLSWMQQASLTPTWTCFRTSSSIFRARLGRSLRGPASSPACACLRPTSCGCARQLQAIRHLWPSTCFAQWVYNRAPNGTTLGGGGIVENNLTILHHPARGGGQYRHKSDQ